jgi:hypothetical protein
MVYINRERAHDEATQVRTKALDKAEYYESLRGPFEDWAKQTRKPEEFINAGLTQIEELVSFWREQYVTGEVR